MGRRQVSYEPEARSLLRGDPKKPVSPSAHRRFPEESPLSWSLDHLSANFFLFISGRHESDPKTGKWGILQLEYISFILHLLGSHRSF